MAAIKGEGVRCKRGYGLLKLGGSRSERGRVGKGKGLSFLVQFTEPPPKTGDVGF
uniref:Uncharacterized protein n=1 Tax=Cucumis melo TaxID=3656 RepID=A0A9I9CRL3_CUCME